MEIEIYAGLKLFPKSNHSLSDRRVTFQILRKMIPDGLEYGTSLLVEYDSRSIWFETSLTIAADALRTGIRTGYHVFQRTPTKVVNALEALGLNVDRLRAEDVLRILDSYTVQTGIGAPTELGKSSSKFLTQSVKISDWSIGIGQQIKVGPTQEDRRRLHIDDNTGVLLQYNDEKTIIDFWRTRVIPHNQVHEGVGFFSLMKGVASEAFYRQFEGLCDGVMEFKAQDKTDGIEQLVRVTTLRGRAYDSRWQQIRLSDNGEVVLVG